MDTEQIRSIVRAAVDAVAPESAGQPIRADQPLREQIELDSMDWLNLIAGLHDRLRVDIPESEHGRLATLDSLVAGLAARLAQPPAAAVPVDTAAALPQTRHLADGTPVTLRPIRADDAALEADFVRHWSGESRYKRFMVTLRELPEAKLKYLTDVDGVHHVAHVATLERDGHEVLLGVARYIVDPAGTGCEFAVSVDDAWQGSGVAGILMHDLIDTARARGLTRMDGIVLHTNHKMLKFARQLGFSVTRDPEDRDTVHVTRAL